MILPYKEKKERQYQKAMVLNMWLFKINTKMHKNTKLYKY